MTGRFYLADGTSPRSLTLGEFTALQQLQAIGYVGAVHEPEGRSGVLRHESEKTQDGLNLFASGHAAQGLLMDMSGRILHRWEKQAGEVWSQETILELKQTQQGYLQAWEYWRRVHLYPNGDLLAIFEGIGIIKLDKDSNLLWANANGAHHDLQVMQDGKIFVLTRKPEVLESVDSRPIFHDSVAMLDANGKEIHSWSLLEAAQRAMLPELLRYRKSGDILHTNTIEVLDGSASRLPQFRKGNFLLSFRHANTIAVVDPERNEIIWTFKGKWKGQHQPTLLPNGNILLFDNWGPYGPDSQQSSVLELDPMTGEVVWEYAGGETRALFTRFCGAAERLPNGNTLITESDRGRALEMTRDKQVVWEFVSPFRGGPGNTLVASVLEMVRLPRDYADSWKSW